jgi:hypothetical protein
MSEDFRDELAAIGTLVNSADLSAESKHTVAWCLKQLPALYGKFCQTNESRYGEEIVRLEQGILRNLAEKTTLSPDAQKVAEDIVDRLRVLHGRFGLQGLDPKPKPVAPTRASSRARKSG